MERECREGAYTPGRVWPGLQAPPPVSAAANQRPAALGGAGTAAGGLGGAITDEGRGQGTLEPKAAGAGTGQWRLSELGRRGAGPTERVGRVGQICR